jgi:primosomal protein N' (replication factor Y)
VLAIRSRLEGAALLIGGYAVTAESAALVESGWAHAIRPTDLRGHAPAVRASGDDAELARDEAARTARLPALAWRTAREALASGPVLVQVPRRGYLPSLACVRCREPARCGTCSGPLALTSGHAIAHCRWCGRAAGGWACPECGSTRFRAQVVGALRTAEELGRAFPGVRLLTSGRDGVLDQIPAGPALVVATPGAEPRAVGGYAAALLLDGWALLDRPDLRAGEEALRRWLSAAALVRPASDGGKVVIIADSARRPVQGLLRWDPWWASARELADRQAVRLPPAVRLAEVTGTLASVEDLLAVAHLPNGADVLEPQPIPGRPDAPTRVRALIRAPLRDGNAMAGALRAAQGVRTARKAPDPVRVRIDPADLD